jgi:hypothetical protein
MLYLSKVLLAWSHGSRVSAATRQTRHRSGTIHASGGSSPSSSPATPAGLRAGWRQDRSRARGTRADGVEGKGAGTPALGGRDAAGMYGEQPREHWTRVTQRCDDTSMTVVQLAFS